MLFIVEIDEDWFDVLDSLIQMTLHGPKATPEEALTIIIFFQFKLQRLKVASSCLDPRYQKEKEVAVFPHDLEPYFASGLYEGNYWDGYEDVQPSFCLETEIEEHLVLRCWSCGVEAQEWDTACFECNGPVA